MKTSAIMLAVTTSTLVFAVLASWMHRRRVRANAQPAAADPERPNLTASVAPLKYSGPIGPTSCLMIANLGDVPVHEVVVSAPMPEQRPSPITLWNLAMQVEAAHIVVGTIWPQRTALVPAHILSQARDPTVLLAGRAANEPWQLELNVTQPSRSRRARAAARRSLHY
jgi:hypothetical protein